MEQSTNCFNFTQRFQEIPNVALVSEFILELVALIRDYQSATFIGGTVIDWGDQIDQVQSHFVP